MSDVPHSVGGTGPDAVAAPHADDDDVRDILAEADRLIAALEAHPDPHVGAQLGSLLQTIDAVHRTGLTHLLAAIQGLAGESFVNRLVADPMIRLLFMSYDLLAVDRRIQAEEALDAVRGHLHAHGVGIELEKVVGGAVYVRLHVSADSGVDRDAACRDVETALRAGLLGFQELVLDAPAEPQSLIQLGGVRRPRRPVHRRVLGTDEIGPGEMRPVQLGEQSILVVNVAGELVAVADRCGDSPLPLRFSTLEGAELRCSWHGCRYDVRTGRRVDGGSDRLTVFPVSVEDGDVRITIATEEMSDDAAPASVSRTGGA